MHKKQIIILLFLTSLLILGTHAGDPHAIWGFCRDGHEGTSAVGAAVSVYIEGRESEIITTKVGSNHEYLIDAGEFSIWETGDIVVIEIMKGECRADKKIVLNPIGEQRVPDLALTCPETPETPDNTTIAKKVEVANEIYTNISGSKTPEQDGLPKTNEQWKNLLIIVLIIVIAAALFIFIFFIKKKHYADDENGTEEISKKSLPEFTNEEVKIIKELAVSGSKESEISGKLGAGISYAIEKLKDRGIVYFDDENIHLSMELRPGFIYEYMLGKEHRDIVMTLKKEGGLKQIEITGKVGFSRTTVSRRLNDLEEMGIVTRCADGTSKKVELSGWFRNNL